MRGVEGVMLKAGFSEVLENVSQKQHVPLEVEAVIVSEGFASKCFPDFMCMLAVFVADMFHFEFAIERVLYWQRLLIEPFPGVHVLVWVDSFLQKEIEFVGVFVFYIVIRDYKRLWFV